MKRLKSFWPILLFFAVVIIFFYPVFKGQVPFPGDLLVSQTPFKSQSYLGYAPGGYPNKAQGPDVIYEIYPWRYFSVSQLKQGQIPFWNPYNFSGNPQAADFQTAIFYPLNFLYFILPFNFSWTVLIMLQPFLAAVFMYLFLKKGIGLKDFPSVLGGIAFGFSSYMTVWIEYGNIGNTILWLPLTLLFTKYFFKKSTFVNSLGIVTSLFLAIIAGYIQGIFYTYVIVFFYYCYLTVGDKQIKNFKKHLLFLLSLGVPVLLSSFQILPTLKLFADSTRGSYSLSQIRENLAPVYYWITGFFPDFFGNPATRNYWLNGTYIERVLYPGSVMIFFALFAAFNKVSVLEKRFFLAVSTITLLIATDLPFIKYFYLIPVPVISTTIPTREFSLFIFSTIVLGAIGISHFQKNYKIGKLFLLSYSLIFIGTWIIVLSLTKFYPAFPPDLKITLHNLFIPSGLLVGIILAILLSKYDKRMFMTLITLILIFDLFYSFVKITPFSGSELIYPKTTIMQALGRIAGINRIWGYGSAYIPANFQTVYGTFSPEGNDPLHIASYGELLASSANGKYPIAVPRPDANIAPGYGTSDLKTNIYRKRILDLLGVKFILNEQDSATSINSPDTDTFPSSDYSLVYVTYPWQIYENKNALPRFFVTGGYQIAKDKRQSLSLIYNENIQLNKTLILEKNPSISIDNNATGTAKLISYGPKNVIISTKTTGNALLFLSDNYYPEWKAKVDGGNTPILIADYSFRAVPVPKGDHTVEFYYDPISFYQGLAASFSGFLILVVYGIISWHVKKNK